MYPRSLLARAHLRVAVLLLCGTATLANVLAADPVSGPLPSNPPPTVVLDMEGRVEVLRKGGRDWETAKPNQTLEAGYRLRTGAKSRATLRLSNFSVLRVGELMEYEIEPPRSAGGKPTLNI